LLSNVFVVEICQLCRVPTFTPNEKKTMSLPN